MTVFRKGEVWDVAVGRDRYRVLVISSDMFNLDSGLAHLLAMEVRDEPGPYSFPIPGERGWHVWPAHLDSTPKRVCVQRVGSVSLETLSEAHTRLFMMLHESTAPPV
ncbi:MAG: hypothetical protein ACRDRP_09785 [Pseudonocardiaceae bacterium]